jgi:hypothetical protein
MSLGGHFIPNPNTNFSASYQFAGKILKNVKVILSIENFSIINETHFLEMKIKI